MKTNIVYMTAANRDEAARIGKALVAARLAACANIIDGMTSIYRWQGELQRDDETVLIAKTTADKIPKLIEKVKAIHGYDCPCILCLPVADGNPDFLRWIAAEVSPAATEDQ